MKYVVVYERASDGGWGAYVPDLPGLGVAGATRAEVEQLVREAIPLHLEALRSNREPIPEPTAVDSQILDVA